MLSYLRTISRSFCTRKTVEAGECSSKQQRLFIDQVRLKVRSGNGGNGVYTFVRDKYRRRGPPDGGSGGNGADVILEANTGLTDLRHFRTRSLTGEHGVGGGLAGRDGKNGGKLLVQIPIGTLVYEVKQTEQGEQKQYFIKDMNTDKMRLTVAHGGKGGKGNKLFPLVKDQQRKGTAGQLKIIKLQLKSLADVGLLGLPNIGKSTFLASISRALPKIANYEFTTLKPSIGCVTFVDGKQIRVADIPGIIKQAHLNKGLGLEFLKHLERTRMLVFMIDITKSNPFEQFEILKNQVTQYNKDFLANKKYIIVLNKIDLISKSEDIIQQIEKILGVPCFGISAKYGDGVQNVVLQLRKQIIAD